LHRSTLEYKGGSQTLVVAPRTPIVTFEPGDRAMVAAGAHIIVAARSSPTALLRWPASRWGRTA